MQPCRLSNGLMPQYKDGIKREPISSVVMTTDLTEFLIIVKASFSVFAGWMITFYNPS